MKLPLVATVLCACWWIAEFIRPLFQAKPPSRDRDKASSRLWDIAHLVGVLGVVVVFTTIGHVQRGQEFIAISGVSLMLVGISIRWLAIFTLGKSFTGKIRILDDHRLVRTGLYRHVRHPAYAGALLAYVGFGFAFSNWISFLLIFLPILFAAVWRMRIEEQVLREVLGTEYLEYSAETKRLIPGIY